jgi:hypothetical protein
MKLERAGQEVIITCFVVLYRHLHGWLRKTINRSTDVSFEAEPATSRTLVRSYSSVKSLMKFT